MGSPGLSLVPPEPLSGEIAEGPEDADARRLLAAMAVADAGKVHSIRGHER
jgi:hypothetical protein